MKEWKDEKTNGRTDPNSQDPSGHSQGSKKDFKNERKYCQSVLNTYSILLLWNLPSVCIDIHKFLPKFSLMLNLLVSWELHAASKHDTHCWKGYLTSFDWSPALWLSSISQALNYLSTTVHVWGHTGKTRPMTLRGPRTLGGPRTPWGSRTLLMSDEF